MKTYKKITYILTICIIVMGSVSTLSASEWYNSQNSKTSKVMKELNTFSTRVFNKTTTPPTISNVRTMIIDSKTCVVVHVEDETGIYSVKINSQNATKKNGNMYSADYYVEITSAGTCSIEVQNNANVSTRVEHSIQINDHEKPTVELSQTFKNGACYLVIDVEDNGSIASVTVNGSSISFDAEGGTENYKVTKSQTYKVVAKDVAGNTTTEKFDVVVEMQQPNLTVDKILKDGKWYLTIKASPNGDTKISKLTVNNSQISIRPAGDTIEYAVPSTGNYTIVVTDSYNQQNSQTVNVDLNVNSKPALSAVQKDLGGVMCIAITAQPSSNIANNSLSSVTVNGTKVAIPPQGGGVEYLVAASGNYTIVATDAHGNTETQNVYITVPTANSTSQPVVNPSSSSVSTSSKVVFTLNQKTWTKNGANQTMDAAPINKNGRIYIPIRYVAYALNIDSGKVTWDAASKTAIIYDGANTVKVPLGSKTMTVNGTSQKMEAAAISQNNRVYIPISQVAKAFSGVSMNWDNTKKQITIARK